MDDFQENDASIALSGSEALVLFEMMSRWMENDWKPDFQDQSERIVLDGLLAELERKLVTPFSSDYVERIAAARKQVRRSFDGG